MGTEPFALKWYETDQDCYKFDHYYDPDFMAEGTKPAYDSAYSATSPAGYDDRNTYGAIQLADLIIYEDDTFTAAVQPKCR